MNFHKALAASLALALLSSVTMAAAAPHRAVHRGRAVFHLPNNTFCFQGDDQVAWIYTASSGNFIAGTDGYNYLPRGGTWKRDDIRAQFGEIEVYLAFDRVNRAEHFRGLAILVPHPDPHGVAGVSKDWDRGGKQQSDYQQQGDWQT